MASFISPYYDLDIACRWLKGNHHGHSTVSDGQDAPLDIVKAYESNGYDYLAISEHDKLLEPKELQPHTSMCILPAVEVTSCFGQSLMYLGACKDLPPPRKISPRQIMEFVHAAGGLFVFDHPNWRPRSDYATDELLDTMEGLRAMEIYTGVIERLPGRADATDRWDRLLSKGWHVFGHATDDQHNAADQCIAWNCVQWPLAEPITPAGIMEALKRGRFYASTGVTISEVGTTSDNSSLMVESDAERIHWITRDSVILKKDGCGSSRLSMDESPNAFGTKACYFRAECFGNGSSKAWTQPFWLNP